MFGATCRGDDDDEVASASAPALAGVLTLVLWEMPWRTVVREACERERRECARTVTTVVLQDNSRLTLRLTHIYARIVLAEGGLPSDVPWLLVEERT